MTRERGVTLIELMIGVVVIGLVIAGIMIAAQKAFISGQINQTADSITQLAINIKKSYSTAPNYAGLSTALVISAKLVPEHMIQGSALVHDLGGYLDVVPVSYWVASDSFAIRAREIPSEACAKIALKLAPVFDRIDIYSGMGWGSTHTVVFHPGSPGIDRAAVAAACGAASHARFDFFKF